MTVDPGKLNTYVVGGAVRDALLGLPVKDRDHVVVGATPEQMLSAEDLRSCLAFHAGGTAKNWLRGPDAAAFTHRLATLPGGKPLAPVSVRPFVPFTRKKFDWLKQRGEILKALGYHRLMGGKGK